MNPELVARVREALDAAGHERVKIVVSGGFDAAKIARFEALGAPVDSYGVGSSLVRGENDFTADVVRVEGATAQGGPRVPAQPAPRAGRVGLMERADAADWDRG